MATTKTTNGKGGTMTGGELTEVLQRLDNSTCVDHLHIVHASLDVLRPSERQYDAIARQVYRTCDKLGLNAEDLA